MTWSRQQRHKRRVARVVGGPGRLMIVTELEDAEEGAAAPRPDESPGTRVPVEPSAITIEPTGPEPLPPERPARCARITGLAGDGSACVPIAGIHATSCPLWRPPERPASGTAPAWEEQAARDRAKMELVLCECWVRHGQPPPHSATCPAYQHATGPIGDPQDLER